MEASFNKSYPEKKILVWLISLTILILIMIMIGGLTRLTDSGLVNQIKFDGKNTFVITTKGQLFLEEYRRFSDMAEAYGLEM